MSFEHKAFIFDDDGFSSELKPLLESSLRSGNADQIRMFVVSNKPSLTDPYEGEPLDDDWENMIEDKDAHQYGDFALTKYYSPIDDRGLGSEWERVQKMFPDNSGLSFSPVLGMPVGTDSEFFDPGKMGSYFQSNSEVRESLNRMKKLEEMVPDDLLDPFEEFKSLLEQAVNEKKGIYVTF